MVLWAIKGDKSITAENNTCLKGCVHGRNCPYARKNVRKVLCSRNIKKNKVLSSTSGEGIPRITTQ